MSVIAELSIRAEDFVLGRALQQTTGLSVELEKMVPMGETAIPYFWVIGEGTEQFEAVLSEEPELSRYEAVDELDGRTLYRAEWNTDADTFVQLVDRHEAVLQEATGDAERWTFQLRFEDSHQLSGFHTACRENGVDLTVKRLYNPIEPTGIGGIDELTEAQRSLIETLYTEGYFDIPRKVTLVEVADELGISDQAVNERLRRGLRVLIGATLDPEPR